MVQDNDEFYIIHTIDNKFNYVIDGIEYFIKLITFNVENKYPYDKYLYVFD